MILTSSQPKDSSTPVPPSEPPAPPVVPPGAPFAGERNFLWDHFAVLLVFTVFCLLLGAYMLEIHWSGNESVITWLQNQINQLLGAILMGLTGAAAVKSGGQK